MSWQLRMTPEQVAAHEKRVAGARTHLIKKVATTPLPKVEKVIVCPPAQSGRGKYGNVRVEKDGYKFDSKREAARYEQLVRLQTATIISKLEIHPRINLVVEGVKIGAYVADFSYVRDGKLVVEDVKGVKTPVYKLKKKLVKALHGIEIEEIR